MISGWLTKDTINEVIKSLASSLNGKHEIVDAEGEVYGRVFLDNEHIFDIRSTPNINEFYLKINNNTLQFMGKLGFDDVRDLIQELSDKFGNLPKSVVISKVLPSRSVYILIEPNESFLPVRAVHRGDFYEVSLGNCTVSNEGKVCEDEELGKLVDHIQGFVQKFWKNMFD